MLGRQEKLIQKEDSHEKPANVDRFKFSQWKTSISLTEHNFKLERDKGNVSRTGRNVLPARSGHVGRRFYSAEKVEAAV